MFSWQLDQEGMTWVGEITTEFAILGRRWIVKLRIFGISLPAGELRREIKPFRPLAKIEDTFGMFAGDPDFDEIVRLGREYREQVNAEDA